MKKIVLIILFSMSINFGMAQNKTSVAIGEGCYAAYLTQWASFDAQFFQDLQGCLYGLASTWYDAAQGQGTMDKLKSAVDAIANATCAMDALNRYNLNVDQAANAMFACNGLVVTPK